jgi:hypothetical protein
MFHPDIGLVAVDRETAGHPAILSDKNNDLFP